MGEDVRRDYEERVRLAIQVIREQVLHISARDLSRKIDVGWVDSVSRWERGEGGPTAANFFRVLELAGFDLSEKGIVERLGQGTVHGQLNDIKRELRALRARTTRTLAERASGLPAASAPFERYISIHEAAKLKGVTRSAVDYWIRNRSVQGYVLNERERVLLREDVEKLKVKKKSDGNGYID